METLQKINVGVSVIIMIVSLWLLFQHYADTKSKLEMVLKKWQYYFLKLGLVFMAMGTFFNITKEQPTPESEILLNVGLALFLIFMAMLFNKVFITHTKGVDPAGEEFPDDQDK